MFQETTISSKDTGREGLMEGKFISYLRVSTTKQGVNGLGIEAQRNAITDYLNGGNWTLIREFVEVESGKRNDKTDDRELTPRGKEKWEGQR
jgi:hypothetical protein